MHANIGEEPQEPLSPSVDIDGEPQQPSSPPVVPEEEAAHSTEQPALPDDQVSTSSLSTAMSDADETADGGAVEDDGGRESGDEHEELSAPPSPPSYDTPFLLPPVRSTKYSRSTLVKLLTFSHQLPSSSFSLLCLPIPQAHLPPSKWSPMAREAHALLREMTSDGGYGSSNSYYLLLAAASSRLVSAAYFAVTEESGTYTVDVLCFCTRTELQGRGCGRVLYEALRELRCRVSQWLLTTRPGCSGCRLVVHSVDDTLAMWQTRFGLRRADKGRGSGGYRNTTALVDGRRDETDRRAEWLERMVRNTGEMLR